MMRIKRLPKEVYDLIAAGEVVLAPVSVVKELVENALDAGADRIVVETAGGGIDRIRVFDNGSGIAREDIELAFMPHATSKLDSAEDLLRIETLGFRGEALASIAAVSAVKMVTKTEDEDTGTRADTEGGSPLKLAPAGADRGTDITVKRLFFNIPARKKHMGGARAEGRRVAEYLAKAAASRPDAAFRLISDGGLAFSTPGNGDRLAAIASAYGSKAAESLLPVSAASGDMRLEGYISGVLGLRGNRKGQHVFVNGRPVTNAAAIEAAVSRAYREFAEPGRFPAVFLFLDISPEMVDVNVHPAKNEVSFADAEGAGAFVEKAIRETLCSGNAIPRLRAPLVKASDFAFHYDDGTGPEAAAQAQGGTGPVPPDDGQETKDGDVLVSTSGGDGVKVAAVDIRDLLSGGDGNIILSTKYEESEPGAREPGLGLSENTEGPHYEGMLDIQGLGVLATLFATYILATDGGAFYIIDQHAAHERVNYERFSGAIGQGGIAAQGLLAPYLFTLPATLADLTEYLGFFAKIGYEIDEFGDRTWAARTFPAFVAFEEGEAFLIETLAALGDEKGRETGISAAAAERVMMRACKASVKANRELSGEEGEALLDALSKCENPYTCPHGRPVFLKLTRGDIERLFKRA